MDSVAFSVPIKYAWLLAERKRAPSNEIETEIRNFEKEWDDKKTATACSTTTPTVPSTPNSSDRLLRGRREWNEQPMPLNMLDACDQAT